MSLNTIKSQQGIATVLIVLLVGVALSASTLGVIYSVKSTQSKQITSHASTNAQSAAWALAEATRVYLSELSPAALSALEASVETAGAAGYPIVLSNLPASLAHLAKSEIVVKSVHTPDDKPRFEITVNAIDTLSKSTASLNVVYEVMLGSAPRECRGPGGSQFTGILDGHDLDIRMSGDGNEISVDGSYLNSNNQHTFTGIRQFSATGDILLNGTATGDLEILRANGTITARVTTPIARIEAGKDIIIPDGSNQDLPYLLAGGDISWGAHNKSDKMQAGAYIQGEGYRTDREGTVSFTKGTNFGTLITRGVFDLSTSGAPSSIDKIYSLSDVTFSANAAPVNDVTAVGNITCIANPTLDNVEYGGQITGCSGYADGMGAMTEEQVLALITALKLPPDETEPLLATYIPVELKSSTIADANGYPSNFAFTYDQATQEIRVKVTEVYGVSNPDGSTKEYVYSHTPYPNALTPVGQLPSETDFRICSGTNQPCINFIPDITILTDTSDHRPTFNGEPAASYDFEGVTEKNDLGVIPVNQPRGLWVVTPVTKELPPGIFYFDRDLRLTPSNDARLANGFLSAGDVQTSRGVPMIYALNGLSAEILCSNNAINDTTGGQHNAEAKIAGDTSKRLFAEQNGAYAYPTNFCNDDATKYRSTVAEDNTDPDAIGEMPYIGQFVIMAGQENTPEDPEEPATYQGGNFYAQTSGSFYGRIIAGNTFNSADQGNISVHGSVGSEARASGKSNATNEIVGTIDVHSGYLDKLEASDGDGAECKPSPGVAGDTKLIWSRYL